MKIKEFLKEDSKYSMMRLVTLLIVLVALIIALVQVAISKEHSFDYVSISAMLTLAITGKIYQKHIEAKNIK